MPGRGDLFRHVDTGRVPRLARKKCRGRSLSDHQRQTALANGTRMHRTGQTVDDNKTRKQGGSEGRLFSPVGHLSLTRFPFPVVKFYQAHYTVSTAQIERMYLFIKCISS